MSYCPKCGTYIEDEAQGCTLCMGTQPTDGSQEDMPIVLKIVIIVLVIFTSGLGSIAGIIGGITLTKHESIHFRAFGKTLLIVSIVMIVLNFICCLVWGFFNMAIIGNTGMYL